MTFRFFFSATISLLLTSCANKSRSERIMDDIEAHIEMPEGAFSIDKYTRSYFGRGGIIKAIYVNSNLARTKGRHWNPDLIVSLQGGGCSQVNVTYDIATQAVTAHCNGPK